MRVIQGWRWLLAIGVLALLAGAAEARGVRAPWEPLPNDAKLVTDPAALTALFADRTVHGINFEDGSKWREYTAPDGRTIWEYKGCLYPGTWRVSGSAVCYAYPSRHNGRPACIVVYQSTQLMPYFVWLDTTTGDQVLFGKALDVSQGNPGQLPLDGAPSCGEPSA